MTVLTDIPNSPRPTARARSGWDANPVTRWMRANLFGSIGSTITTLILGAVLAKALVNLVQWGILNAVWSVPGSDTNACRAAARDRRLLGGHPREISLHPVRHLPV